MSEENKNENSLSEQEMETINKEIEKMDDKVKQQIIKDASTQAYEKAKNEFDAAREKEQTENKIKNLQIEKERLEAEMTRIKEDHVKELEGLSTKKGVASDFGNKNVEVKSKYVGELPANLASRTASEVFDDYVRGKGQPTQ